MADIRITSIAVPLDRPPLANLAMQLVRKAAALGLLPDKPIRQLDLPLVKSIAREASEHGVGQDASAGLLARRISPGRLEGLIGQLDQSLEGSSIPDREAAALLGVFGRDGLADLLGTSQVSLGRYVSGSRAWPDDVAARLHWLALVVGDLHGGYNDFGVRRWFERPRPQLRGRTPRQFLGARWDPDSHAAARVRELAGALAGPGGAT
ncbi:MAG: hypothetical protein FIA92_10080 [Chloroflexi bacterium]|nr:hypothetical protein [Chloroflexota bacterium]